MFKRFLPILLVLCGLGVFGAPAAFAAERAPQWTVTAVSVPTVFTPRSAKARIFTGCSSRTPAAKSSNGEPVTITDESARRV